MIFGAAFTEFFAGATGAVGFTRDSTARTRIGVLLIKHLGGATFSKAMLVFDLVLRSVDDVV
jgi:hypothetical protein